MASDHFLFCKPPSSIKQIKIPFNSVQTNWNPIDSTLHISWTHTKYQLEHTRWKSYEFLRSFFFTLLVEFHKWNGSFHCTAKLNMINSYSCYHVHRKLHTNKLLWICAEKKIWSKSSFVHIVYTSEWVILHYYYWTYSTAYRVCVYAVNKIRWKMKRMKMSISYERMCHSNENM